MRYPYFILGLISLFAACKSVTKSPDSSYLRWVGDIAFDPAVDDSTFNVCDAEHAKQYHNFSKGMQYRGEKIALQKVFKEKYKAPKNNTESGLIRIRFLVNCKGQSGRFRMQGMNEAYQAYTFDSKISNQLLQITKELDGWLPLPNPAVAEDYYQYLIFKINKGELIEIMP